MKEKKRPISSG